MYLEGRDLEDFRSDELSASRRVIFVLPDDNARETALDGRHPHSSMGSHTLHPPPVVEIRIPLSQAIEDVVLDVDLMRHPLLDEGQTDRRRIEGPPDPRQSVRDSEDSTGQRPK